MFPAVLYESHQTRNLHKTPPTAYFNIWHPCQTYDTWVLVDKGLYKCGRRTMFLSLDEVVNNLID